MIVRSPPPKIVRMNALALALALAWGPPDFEDDRLPRSLSESFVLPVAASIKEEHEVLVGLHGGAALGVDGAQTAGVAGFDWRIDILPWLGAAGSIDFLSKEPLKLPGAEVYQIPLMWCFLLYPPIDLGPFRPYGLAGFGFTITDLSGGAVRNSIDINLLGCAGFGLEIELTSNVLFDASVRYVWAKAPPGTGDYNADWRQCTAGVLVKLPR